MTLNLLKLCVGCDSVRDLTDWVDERLAEKRRLGQEPVHIHRTRQMPKRRDEILEGGSLYWVIKGSIMLREPIVDLRAVTDENGVPHCDIVLTGAFVQVEPRRFRPFQGWRYLDPKEAPADLRSAGARDLPPEFVKELAGLGLL
ncbi:DUF1489 family protein [Prosthecodimorpha staleyi]|uniref:DUF1489 domain-containing protein n=1 Tax=Prosthecodimorpha staleyi TaxID=2840188 RepID=A0A947GER8_9HYPH|nr:DUF1489 domain-containing protein [Prosthecodimorpha staleyi]MBT9292292.1 DUF1489 domain-containing protein [Prosthecodimorpha staleyi]